MPKSSDARLTPGSNGFHAATTRWAGFRSAPSSASALFDFWWSNSRGRTKPVNRGDGGDCPRGDSPLRPLISSLVGVFGLNLEFFLAGFAHPVVLAIDESVVMDSATIVFSAQITLHPRLIRFCFGVGRACDRFQGFFIRDLRLHGSRILLLDGLINLVAVDRYVSGCFDPEPDIVAADPKDLDLNLIPDDQLFVFFTGNNEHTGPPPSLLDSNCTICIII